MFAKIRAEINNTPVLAELRDQIILGEASATWEAHDGLIFNKGRVFVSAESDLVQDIFLGFHNFGHKGVQKTMDRIRRDFYCQGWKKTVTRICGDFSNLSKKQVGNS